METKYINKSEFEFSNVRENVEMFIYTFIAFMVPFTLGHPQQVVGIIVNAALVFAALNLKGYKLIPVIVMPSIAVLLRGLIFGPYTIYLVFMIPFIWIGNAVLVLWMKKFAYGLKKNKVMSLAVGIAVKVVFLFGAAYLLVSLGVVPAIFLTTMGMLQLITAVIGGGAALGINELRKKWLAN